MGQSEIVELESRLDFDLANQNLFLLNNLDVLFTIYRHDDNFLIQSLRQGDTNTYRLKVHNMRLRVKTVDVNSSVNPAVGNTLEKTMAKYPVRKTEIRSCYLTPGRTEFVLSDYCEGSDTVLNNWSAFPRRPSASAVPFHEVVGSHTGEGRLRSGLFMRLLTLLTEWQSNGER
ncbi:Protein F19G12.2 [Aphelenchoides avenae]|nr:Protein F19G12.2 [Aphelenchus avenae]